MKMVLSGDARSTFRFVSVGILLIFLNLSSGCGAGQEDLREMLNSDELKYDSLYAKEAGADAYGMKQYYFAFLKSGPSRSQDSVEAARIQRAHLDNIKRMARAGLLVLGGPFMDRTEIRGIYIFNVSTLEEAQALASTDPAVQAGRLIFEFHPWYGSAALQEVGKIHKLLSAKEI